MFCSQLPVHFLVRLLVQEYKVALLSFNKPSQKEKHDPIQFSFILAFINFHATEMCQFLNLTVLELHLYCDKPNASINPALRQSDVCLRAQFFG